MEKIFLHILQDEKVVNSFISMMEEAFPNENTYLIFTKGESPKRVKERENVISFDQDSKELKSFLSDLSRYKHICLHSIGGEKFYQYILHPSISWVVWGADLYVSLLRFKGYNIYYDNKKQYKIRAGRWPVWFYKLLTDARDYIIYRREEKIVDRLRYLITDNGCDYGVFRQYYGDKNIIFPGTINYYPIDNLIDETKRNEECSGNSIWVGNSADPNGNHTWVFEKIACLDLPEDVMIMSPISYGDRRFMKYINDEGCRILGNRFFPLKDFLPVNDYYARFLQANSFIFGHFRQTAVGNIVMALYFGGKVFLSNRNPLLPMYKEYGFEIYSIEDDMSKELVLEPLSNEKRKKNRELVLSIASYERSIAQLKSVYGRIKSDSQ